MRNLIRIGKIWVYMAILINSRQEPLQGSQNWANEQFQFGQLE